MKSIYNILAIISIMFVISACKSGETVKNQAIAMRMQERPNNIQSDMSISINSEDVNVSGKAKVQISGNDSISMDIYGPFGIKFGKLYADTNMFYFYNAMENMVIKGKPTAENIRKATYLNISAAEIINLFKNMPPSKISDYIEYDPVSSGLIYKHKNEFLVLNEDQQMIQYQRKNELDQLELNILYQDFMQYEIYNMPSAFIINAPIAKSKVSLTIKKMTFPKVFTEAFKFSVPASAKVIEL